MWMDDDGRGTDALPSPFRGGETMGDDDRGDVDLLFPF